MEINHRVYQIHKEDGSCGQSFDSSRTFLNPLVGTNSLYGKRTVVFFSLASHARRLLRHALPIFVLILRKKPTVLQSIPGLEPTHLCDPSDQRRL